MALELLAKALLLQSNPRDAIVPANEPERRMRRHLASRSTRMVARVLDLLCIIALGLVPFAAAVVFSPASIEAALQAAGVIAVAYLLLADALLGGAGPGKRVAGLRVVDSRTGRLCSTANSLLRSAFFLCGPFDWLLIFGHRRRRLGDIAARTDVIED